MGVQVLCYVCYYIFNGKGEVRAWIAKLIFDQGLYTDESPGLKVDPVVVLVLSLGFIFSVVALHSTFDICNQLSSE